MVCFIKSSVVMLDGFLTTTGKSSVPTVKVVEFTSVVSLSASA